jgi:hypothetical protein
MGKLTIETTTEEWYEFESWRKKDPLIQVYQHGWESCTIKLKKESQVIESLAKANEEQNKRINVLSEQLRDAEKINEKQKKKSWFKWN